jgi:pimeloyl-ACP methyl ester carboxylesterase
MSNQVEKAYELARERYATLGVDTDTVMQKLAEIPISLHCWQGDDVEFPAWAASKKQLDKTIFGFVRVLRPWREFVSAFTVPALLITADVAMNAIVTSAVAEEAASLSSVLQIAHVPHAGHNIRRENYPAFLEAVQGFLGQQ